MKITGIYFDNFFSFGPSELLEECRYGKEMELTGYIFKNHLWYSFVREMEYLTDGSLYMTVDNKLIFSATIENGKATVYLVRNGQRFEYRTFKLR